MSAAKKANVLGMYRRMLRLGSSVRPEEKRVETVAEIKAQFRKNAADVDEEKVEELLKKANSSLGYLKMITPRSRSSNEKQTGQTRLVFGEGGPREGKAVSNWTGSNMDPDQVKRHYAGLQRAGFSDNRSVLGKQGF